MYARVRSIGCSVLVLVVCGSGSTWAADISLSLTSGGAPGPVVVPPGEVVPYEVTAALSDTNNEGLALILFDLSFDGGDLAQGDTPTMDPMANFVMTAGITNPAGYGGTVIDGTLVQCGGAQNTINNDIDNAPFPLADTVFTGVAHTPQEVMTGSLEAPAEPGVYTLAISNTHATVIRAGETGDPFWATELTGVSGEGTLVVEVAQGTCPGDGGCCAPNGTPGCDDQTCCEAVCAQDPACCAVEWDQPCADLAAALCPACAVEPIPTITEWGMVTLALLVCAAGAAVIARGRRQAAA